MRYRSLLGRAGVAAVAAAVVFLAAGDARAHALAHADTGGHGHTGAHDRTAGVDRIVDQGVFLDPQQCYSTSFDEYQPLGQSFRPALSGMDFVEFFIEDAVVGPPDPAANYVVRVHSGSITGPVVGTSNVTAVPDGTNTGGGDVYTTFTFPSIVPLVPGSTYYLELQQLNPSATRSFLVCGRLSDAYAAGTQIQGGVPVPGRDLNFRVGLLVPEPSALGLLAVGTLVLVRRRERRP